MVDEEGFDEEGFDVYLPNPREAFFSLERRDLGGSQFRIKVPLEDRAGAKDEIDTGWQNHRKSREEFLTEAETLDDYAVALSDQEGHYISFSATTGGIDTRLDKGGFFPRGIKVKARDKPL